AECVQRPPELLTPWTRACALYAIGRQRLRPLAPALAQADAFAAEPLLRETAAWAKAELADVALEQGRSRAMLAIEKVLTLKSVPMFARSSEDVLAEIAAILEEMEVEAGPGDLPT